MTMKRKIILTVLLGVLAAVAVWCVVMDVKGAALYLELISETEPGNVRATYIRAIIYCMVYFVVYLGCLCLSIARIIYLWKKDLIYIKYSYQDYLNNKKTKEKQKKERKKEKLLNKLSKFE